MWRITNRGNGVDIHVGGVKCYLAPNSVIRTDNAELVEAARKVPYVRVAEDFGGLGMGKLRMLASQRGVKSYSRFTKKKLIEKLTGGEK